MLRTGLRTCRRGSFASVQPLVLGADNPSLQKWTSADDGENLSRLSWRDFSPTQASSWAWRGLQTSNGPREKQESGDKTVLEMNSILQRIDAAHFTEVLHHAAQTQWNMHEDQFTSLCIDCGAAHSKKEALEICDALDKSGVVLRIKNLVYLRPLEVAEILFKALPDTAQEIKARLNQLKAEAEPLLVRKAQVDAHADRYARRILWTGLTVFTLQMILYARLTFWELSWDVMEPITYFTSATFAVLGYLYCMWHNEEFGVLSAGRRISSNVQNKKYAENGLDTSKLDFLLHRINHLEATIDPVKQGAQKESTDKSVGSEGGSGSIADPIGLQPVGQGVV